MEVYIIGMGPGNPDLLTSEARGAICRSSVLIGSRRIVEPFRGGRARIYETYKPAEIRRIIAEQGWQDVVSVLVSGDVGFFSLAQSLDCPQGCTVRRIAGISSIAYFAARLGQPWQDAYVVSRHGRQRSVAAAVCAHKKVFCLTGGESTAGQICRELCQAELGSVRVDVGIRLSYDDEQIVSGTAAELAGAALGNLAVMMIYNDAAFIPATPVHGLPDDVFQRGGAPMTKRAVRSVAISLLQPAATDIVYDIGAGTGSCSVELARQVPLGRVYAFECDAGALELLRQNCERFALTNLTIVTGRAEETIGGQPAPDCAFIGGTKGQMAPILDGIYKKKKDCAVVMTAVTLETMAAVLAYYGAKSEYSLQITQLQAAVAKEIGPYHMMTGQNPVYIVSARYIN